LIELNKTNLSEYDKRLQQIFDILFALAFFVAVITSFLAVPGIPFLYGEAYTRTSPILIIHIWAGIFMFMKAIIDKWVLIENALHFQLMIHGGGALLNVLLNFILIPKFGGIGSAVATLLSYAASSYLFLFFYSRSRNLAIKISKAFIFPLRLFLFRAKIWDHFQ
jgi:O-antigen/teichoic acid export membrane protein